MDNLEIIFFLLLIAVLLVGIAQKINVPYPLILILAGGLLSFIPGLGNIYFNPNLVLTIFLPPILYYSAFGISFREFKKNWKSIFSLALGLVALTTLVVGVIFKSLFPQFSWALCFTFGAIISPPDAVSVTAILKRFSMSTRLITLLEGESLINDASAIVIYKITLVALMTGSLSLSHGSFLFFYVVIGGIFVGLILGLLFQLFSSRYLEPVLGVVFSFTIPYVTYILADILEVSGVLAVVVNGLIGSHVLHKHHSSLRRVVGYAVWDVIVILIHCLVFILMGLQVRTIAIKLGTEQLILYSAYAFIFVFAMVVVRLIWVYGIAALAYITVIRYRNSSKKYPQLIKEASIVGWAGMRGIVSLAIALALPFTLPDGSLLEGRNEVVFITFMVILITLLIPGLTLPVLISWLKLDPVHVKDYEKTIRAELALHTQEKLKILYDEQTINQQEYRFLKSYFSSQHKVLALAHEADHGISNLELARRKIILFQRAKLVEIWKSEQIDDKLLNHLENELDMLVTHTARVELK